MMATSKPSRACKFMAGVMLVFIGTVTYRVQAQTAASSTLYQLNKDASFEQGCFAPCLCAVMLDMPVSGTFLLVPLGTDPLFNTYLVTNVNWNVPIDGTNMVVTGNGTYKVGGEVAVQQQLLLDLQLGGSNVNHFDSGLVAASAPFPQIVTTISTNHQYCFDTVFNVSASPMPVPQTLVAFAATNSIVISWPVSSGALILQQSSDLAATNWTMVTNAPLPVGQQNQVILTRAPGNRFYRLEPKVN